MKRMTGKSTAIFVICLLLLFSFAKTAKACWPPSCPDCYYWNGYTCVPYGDCRGGCPECYKCSNCWCVPCKCWDKGTAISGSITVQNAKLCEQKTHTSSVSDTDHWFLGGDGHGYPSDSITYSWSKSPGSNPQSGTWKSGTTSSSVDWQAPPCTGTVNIKLTANDVPNSMDNPCAGSTRNDDANDFEDTSTVSLPSGCSDCGTPANVTPSITEDTSCTDCCDSYGYCDVTDSTSDHTYTLKTPCYDNCKWYAFLDSVDTTVEICRSCPSNPATVCCLGDVSGMTQQQACDQYDKYPHDPLLIDDMFTEYFEDNCWCRDCVAVHEETHMNQDWVTECLQPQIDALNTWCSSHGIDIDCSVSPSTDCTTALTPAEKTAYDNEWDDRVTAAYNNWINDPDPEGDAEAAERDCYQEIIDALFARCVEYSEEDCEDCDPGKTPSHIYITFAGVTDCGCMGSYNDSQEYIGVANCLNGTHLLTQIDTCRWHKNQSCSGVCREYYESGDCTGDYLEWEYDLFSINVRKVSDTVINIYVVDNLLNPLWLFVGSGSPSEGSCILVDSAPNEISSGDCEWCGNTATYGGTATITLF